MGYTPNEWHPLDVITSEKLNELEKGLTKTSENVVYGSGGALQSSDGIHSLKYIKKGDPLPSNPQVGDTIFVIDSNDFSLLEWDGEQWSIRVDPKLSERIKKTLDTAKADTADLISKNNDAVKSTIDEVAKAQINLVLKEADFNKKAQAMADKALADAKAETVQAAQEALNSANKHLADAKKDLTESISKEASARNEAVADANSLAQKYVDEAKRDINDTINALSVGGRNLLLGTANDVTGVGHNVINEPFGYYSLVGGKKVSDLYNQYGSSGYLTISFDWVATGSTISGTFIQQWVGNPWGGLSDSDIKVSSTNSSGHYEHTVALSTDGYSTSWASGIRFRQDYLQGNITISNLKLESGNIATDWTPAPEDVVLDYTTKDNKIKETITQYQDTNDGKVRKAQTDATTALGLVETKVSQTDYDKKTGDLATKYTQVKQTADSQATDIVDIKKTATSQASKINSISSDVDGTKQSISDIEKTQHGQFDKINQITNDVNGTKQSIADIQTKDGKQDARMGTIETSVSGVKSDFSSYKATNDGVVKTAQTTAQTAVDGLKTKVSQTDYNKKTGQLQTDLTTTTQTANQATTDIASIKKKDGEQDEKMNTIVSDANGTKQTVSDLKTAQDKQSGYISTLQQRADGFDATVTKVNNLSIGGRNLYTDTKNFDNLASWWNSIVWTKTTDSYNGLAVIQTSNDWNGISQHIPVKKGDVLTYSAYVKYTSDTGTSMILWRLNNQTEGSYSTATTNPDNNAVTITDSWQRISATAVATSDGYLRPRLERTDNNTNILQITGIKVEKGNVATDWTPAPEDIETALAQVKVTADGVSSIVSNPTTGLSVRVQTAEGTLNTVKSTADGAMSKASQTANDITKEISDRKTGDSNTLQSSKDFTTSQITNSETGTKSLITQTAEGIIAKVDTKTDSDTVLSLLKNNWSIGITDNIGKITSGIVDNASQMSLISKNVMIDSPNTQIKGTAWIQSAMIANGAIGSAQIGDATITSAKIATLDVAKLTGNTTSFIKSNWSSAYGNVSITPTNITLQSYTGDTLMSEFSMGDLGMTVKMPGVSSFLDSTIINANGMSFQHGGGSYATVGVMDAGFTLENNILGGAPMSIRIGDGVHNKAEEMAFAISAAQSWGTSPQLIWAGNKVGKVSSKYRTWDNPHGFILAEDIKFSTWDTSASRVEFDDTVNFYNYAPIQVYGQRFSDGTTRTLHLSGKEVSSGAKWFGFLDGGDQAGFGTDNTNDVIFFMKGKTYSLYTMLGKLGMR